MTINLINALKADLFILERIGYDRIASDIHEAIKQLEQMTLYKNLADEYGLSVFDSVANLEERLSTMKTYYEQVMADGGVRIKALEEENESLRRQLEESKEREKNLVSAVEEAWGWNWLDEDIPLDVYEQIIEVINDSKES